MKTIYYIIITLILFNSCTKVVDDFDLKVQEPKIVINGIAAADSAMSFQILKTAMRNNFSSNPFAVTPSEILLSINETTHSVLKGALAHTYYVPDYICQAGDIINLSVSAKGLNSVQTKTIVPVSTGFTLLDYELIEVIETGCPDCPPNIYLKMSIELNEPEKDNYYAIEVVTLNEILGWNIGYPEDGKGDFPDTTYLFEPVSITSNDGIYEFSQNYGRLQTNSDLASTPEGTKLFFKDNLLPGLKNKITISANLRSINIDSEGELPVKINIYSYTASYYRYLRSIASYNDLGEFPLSEPIYIHSNVENGSGILGSMNVTSRTYYIDPEK